MIQGDEPLVNPEMIDDSILPLLIDANIKITNLMANMKIVEEHEDPAEVKVVVDKIILLFIFQEKLFLPGRRA
jgi:3-deoxy-manno-octulosonate cytidylyltransferase (CMP-KDO synthetase)